MAVPFDLERLTVTGGPVPVVEGVRRGGGSGNLVAATAHLAISNSGGIVYLPGPVTLGSERDNDLAIFDHNDTPKPLGLARGSYLAPRAALDGKWIAFETSDERAAFISLYEIGGNRPARRLTFNGNSRAPVWSPDGQWIAFQSDHEGDEATYRIRADGSGTPERLTRPEKGRSHIPQSWSADGLRLLFADSGGDITTSSLWVYAFADRKATRYGDVGVREATFSPDGRWIAYGARTPNPAANPNRVFVAPYPATQAKYELPIVGGHPVWTRKGDALLINSSPTESFFVPVRTVPSFAFGQPQPFPRQRRIEANPVTNRRQVDVLPDGRVVGVLSSTAVAAIESSQIIVVTNWFDEIRQRVRSR
jgi:Tol biopolymer transport system component